MDALARHHAAGVHYVSVNIGMDFNPITQVMRVIAGFRAWIAAHGDQFLLAHTVSDIWRAKDEGKRGRLRSRRLGHAQGRSHDVGSIPRSRSPPDPSRLQPRQLDRRGCHGADVGLTPLGRQVVAEINRVGMIMDCSHTGYRSRMEIMEISTRPVVFSHSNVRALREHPRNIRTEFAGYDLALRPARVRNLLTLLEAVLPQVWFDPATARPWCGLRAMSVDGVPIIGPTPIEVAPQI